MRPALDERDLLHVLDHTRDVWRDFEGARVLLTGASGFIGSWLLESLLFARNRLGVDVRAWVLVRDAAAFARRLPHLAGAPQVRLLISDVRDLDTAGLPFTHVIHAASAASPQMNEERPDEVVDLIERGTRRVLEAAVAGGASRFLQISSGSVYGPQPPALRGLDESYPGRADANFASQRFGAAKLAAEDLGRGLGAGGPQHVAARIFGLVGPRLPLDGQFALGSFLGDALAGRTVALTSDGSPIRTWMHAADLTAWCWTLLSRGRADAAYNVGSEQDVSLWEAAGRVAALPTPAVTATRPREPQPGAPPPRFVPSIARARTELGLDAWIDLDEALRRTWGWLRAALPRGR